jgi:membrane-associated phospholipid phosphatase
MRKHVPFAAALALAALSASPLRAQGAASFPYALDPFKDGAWIAADLGLYGASLYLDGRKPALTAADLDSSKIPFFDRAYTTSHSAALGTAADGLVFAIAALPASALPGLGGKSVVALGTMYAETLGLAYGLDAFLKSAVTRARPYAYASPPPGDIGSADISGSFPSRHATLAFASAVFAGTVFDATHPGSPYRAAVWAGGLGAAAVVGAIRVASGDHFLSDVVAGSALGALIGWAVPYLHRAEPSAGGGAAALALDPLPTGILVDLRL